MFFYFPLLLFSGSRLFLIALAVIPALILLWFVYRNDRLEKEPKSYLYSLMGKGIISTFLASMCERLGGSVISWFFTSETVLYRLLLYFLVVGLSEEAAKYILLERNTWYSPNFNCKFDALVYSVSVSLGFALWENIGYVLSYGLETGLLRAVTAVPGHACFGVVMGIFYGLSKRCEIRGDQETKELSRKLAIAVPAFVHGLYDFLASSQNDLYFWVFIVILFITCFVLVKRLSSHDAYL